MAILPILIAPDPRLAVKSTAVEIVTNDLRQLIEDMLETMYAAPGIGLAAIQVGVPRRVIVMDLAREGEAPEPRHFINPELTWSSDDYAVVEEGCLSVPEIYDEVERPARVRVTYLDDQGARCELEADGLLATCLQHEMDHLEGVLFIDRLSKLRRDMVVRKLVKSKRRAVM